MSRGQGGGRRPGTRHPRIQAVQLMLARYPELMPDDLKRIESHAEARDGEK